MKKTVKCICYTFGIALLVAALSLVLYNVYTDKKSGETANQILVQLKEIMPEPHTETAYDIPTAENYDLFEQYIEHTEQDEESKIPTIELDGNIYIGIIYIPKIGIELPVLKNWSYYNLNFSPCRYKGTVSDNNMILAAHNYRSHFGRIGELNSGDEIQFIDINGIVYSYEVVSTEYVGGTNVEAMNFGASDDWNLTLFTCTLDGQTRVTVRALRTEY